MNDLVDPDPPNGSVPLLDAMRRFLPAEMWDDFDRARIANDKGNSPTRPDYWSMPLTDWVDAKAVYRGSRRTRPVRADPYLAWNALLSAFKLKFQTGELLAFGQVDPPFGPWQVITASAWGDARISNVQKGKVSFGPKEIYGLHVLPLNDEGSLPTGLPGRRSKGAELIRIEFNRRATARVFEPTLAAESRWLADWYHQTHPKNQRVTAKTIENNLRAPYREATGRSA